MPMPTFVKVGSFWVNLELVTSIELVEEKNDTAKIRLARVHYSTGKHQDFKIAADVQDLANFLENHKAP